MQSINAHQTQPYPFTLQRVHPAKKNNTKKYKESVGQASLISQSLFSTSFSRESLSLSLSHSRALSLAL